MSSEYLGEMVKNIVLWNDALDPAEYIEVTYYVETNVDLESAAIAMALEQSLCSPGPYPKSGGFDPKRWSARVMSVRDRGKTTTPTLPTYRLGTPVYANGSASREMYSCAEVTIGFPSRNFDGTLTNLWVTAAAEMHRLGFLSAAKVVDLKLPAPLLERFTGPRHGVAGIRARLGIPQRPIFCRSTRPAVGQSTDMMLRSNEAVLRGGFDAVKDDELTFDTPRSPFTERVNRMMEMIRRVEDQTGEKKLYFANVIGDHEKSLRMAETASRAGAAGVLVAPSVQGLAIARDIVSRTDLMVLSHSTGEDVLHRHPRFGISRSVLISMQRLAGADLAFLSGDFGTPTMDRVEVQSDIQAFYCQIGSLRRAMPIIAGGKRADSLSRYVRDIGSSDFMIIAAAAVDGHPGGSEEGARAFRAAWRAP